MLAIGTFYGFWPVEITQQLSHAQTPSLRTSATYTVRSGSFSLGPDFDPALVALRALRAGGRGLCRLQHILIAASARFSGILRWWLILHRGHLLFGIAVLSVRR